jgi:hypothetical protein
MFTPCIHASGAKPSVRSKNPNRPAGDHFKEPVCWSTVNGVQGHYNADTKQFWTLVARVPRDVSTEDTVVSDLPAIDHLHIPAGAVAVQNEDGTCMEFYDFSGPRDLLYVGGDCLVIHDVRTALKDFDASCKVQMPVAGAKWKDGLGTTVWTVSLGADLKSRAEEVAHRLCAAGYQVSLPFGNGIKKHATIRIQASQLRWVKDADLVQTMAKYADAAISDSMDGCFAPHLELHNVVYDEAMSVARAMMSWGALAAWSARTWFSRSEMLPPPVFDTICEPLASYLRVLFTVQHARMSSASDVVLPTLACNSPQKMSASQCMHASLLFYWCSIHKDEGTRRIPKTVAKQILEMYLRFGHVVLRKRAYQFHRKRQLGLLEAEEEFFE